MSFRPSDILKKNLSSSSRSWLVRQSRDPYVKQRLASATSYRSRSAFKLLEIDKNWGRFLSRDEICAVVDLGAAPGGWSQVVAEKLGWINPALSDEDMDIAPNFGLNERARIDKFGSWSSTAGRGVIVAVDLLPIAPIPGVHTLQMDFLSPQATGAVKTALSTPENPSGMADIILSDMAANFSGNRVRDVESSLDICHSVFQFAKDNLHVAAANPRTDKRRGGTLLSVCRVVRVSVANSWQTQALRASTLERISRGVSGPQLQLGQLHQAVSESSRVCRRILAMSRVERLAVTLTSFSLTSAIRTDGYMDRSWFICMYHIEYNKHISMNHRHVEKKSRGSQTANSDEAFRHQNRRACARSA